MDTMQAESLPQTVHVTVIMEDIRTDVAIAEVFRVHPSTLEEALSIAQNSEHNFKSTRIGWNG